MAEPSNASPTDAAPDATSVTPDTHSEVMATATAQLNAAIEASIEAVQVAADELVEAFRQRAAKLATGGNTTSTTT